MEKQFNITPTRIHQNCIVDVLGRAGRLHEAEKFVHSMVEPGLVAWTALLGACRTHGDVKRANRVSKEVQLLDPTYAASHVLMGNMHEANGDSDAADGVWYNTQQEGVKKIPGVCSIELHGEVHALTAASTDHPQHKEIRQKLEELSNQLQQTGYTPDTSHTLELKDDGPDKLELLCSHSEKQAIALGLLNTPPGTRFMISKNLRVCKDCHEATKQIAKMEQREIVVRDANRIHVFKDGKCSCNDCF